MINYGYAGKIKDLVPYWEKKIAEYESQVTDYGGNRDVLLADAKKQLKYFSLRHGHPNVHKVYLDVRKPFGIDEDVDLDIAKAILQKAQLKYPKHDFDYPLEKLEEFEQMNNITNKQVYQAMSKAIDEDGIKLGNDRVNDFLKSEGYDGIAHIGGAITGNPEHSVLIAFDKKQIIPAWDYDHKLKTWREQLLADVSSEPKVVNYKIENETPYKFDTTSNIDNQEFAFNRFETIDPSQEEVTNGLALIKQAIDDPEYKGLPDLVDDVKDLFAAKIEKETGHPAKLMTPDGAIDYTPAMQNPAFTMRDTGQPPAVTTGPPVTANNTFNIGGGYPPQPPGGGALPPPPGIGGVPTP